MFAFAQMREECEAALEVLRHGPSRISVCDAKGAIGRAMTAAEILERLGLPDDD